MLSLPSIVKIYLHASPVNLHFAFDRLAAIVREEMGYDPLRRSLVRVPQSAGRSRQAAVLG
jgi:hypothetical protein